MFANVVAKTNSLIASASVALRPRSEQLHNSVDLAKPTHSSSCRSRRLSDIHNGTKSVSFVQRVQIGYTWSPTVYNRKGDVATYHILTPNSTQSIKEELNNFKMVRITQYPFSDSTNKMIRR